MRFRTVGQFFSRAAAAISTAGFFAVGLFSAGVAQAQFREDLLVGDWNCDHFGVEFELLGETRDRYRADGALFTSGSVAIGPVDESWDIAMTAEMRWRQSEGRMYTEMLSAEISRFLRAGVAASAEEIAEFERGILAEPGSTADVLALNERYFLYLEEGLLTACQRVSASG